MDPPRGHWEGKKEVREQAKGHEGKFQAEDMPRPPRDQPGGPGAERATDPGRPGRNTGVCARETGVSVKVLWR